MCFFVCVKKWDNVSILAAILTSGPVSSPLLLQPQCGYPLLVIDYSKDNYEGNDNEVDDNNDDYDADDSDNEDDDDADVEHLCVGEAAHLPLLSLLLHLAHRLAPDDDDYVNDHYHSVI